MFDDDLPKKKVSEFPRTLDPLSVSDLREYIEVLREEIDRVEVDIDKKKASQDLANSVFKS